MLECKGNDLLKKVYLLSAGLLMFALAGPVTATVIGGVATLNGSTTPVGITNGSGDIIY